MAVLSAVVIYKLHAQDLGRALDRVASQRDVSRETAYYSAKIENVRSIENFLADDRLFAFALKAFGLEEMRYAKAFFRKLLTEGIDSPKAFANKLLDQRYREFAETFNFERYGSATTTFTRARQGVVDRYIRQSLEENLGSQNEGARLALYFQRKAPTITNAYSILADQALLAVVQTALGLPPTISALDIDRQAALIERRLRIDDLKDPVKLQRFIERFLVLWDVNNPPEQVNTALLPVRSLGSMFSPELLFRLQTLQIVR